MATRAPGFRAGAAGRARRCRRFRRSGRRCRTARTERPRRRGNRDDAVPRVVHRRAHQVVHRGIQHDEPLPRSLFRQNNRCEQHARRPHQPTSRFQRDPDIQVVERRLDRAGQQFGAGSGLIAVRNAKSAAAVDGFYRWPWSRRVRTRSAMRAKAARYGAMSRIWLPIWVARPTGSIPGNRAASA